MLSIKALIPNERSSSIPSGKARRRINSNVNSQLSRKIVLVAAFMMSYMVSKAGKLSYIKAVVIFSAGSLVILALGCAHLVIAYKMNVVSALSAGFVPFIPAEALEIAAAAGFYGLKK